jgi:hypothetical protein
MLRAIDEVQFESLRMNDTGLESMYTKKQVNEFAALQGSQGTRRAYLVETAEMGHNGRNDMGEWVSRPMLRLLYGDIGFVYPACL